jgi:tetratricopeptide (TPR) repeat protein
MARTILTAALIILLHVLVGCQPVDSGRSQMVAVDPSRGVSAAMSKLGDAGESDLVEQVAINRQVYREALVLLVAYYMRTGDSTKLAWAQKELDGLDAMPQYNYILGAGVAGPDLRATTPILDADYMYRSARELQEQAGLIIKDENKLRLGLAKYNELIDKFPSSDKIDDAAYHAGEICEHFKDYTIAVLYYQRTYQWNPQTEYPARFREAYILDQHLRERAKALQAYERALASLMDENEHIKWRQYAEKRVRALTKTEEPGE